MRYENSLDEMTPEQRRREIAIVLARGVVRHWKQRRRAPNSNSRKPSETGGQGLELSRESRLSVTTG